MRLPFLIDLPGRDEAREAAHHELQKAAYGEAQPPLTTRILTWILNTLQDLLARATTSVPGGRIGFVLLLLLVGGLIALVLVTLRPSVRTAHVTSLFESGHVQTAAEHRALSEAAAAAGDHAEAVRERLRAVVRGLEEQGILDPRPGRTADEVTREAGGRVAELAEPLRRGTRTFEQIWYGGRPADSSSYAVLVEVDREVQQSRRVLA